MPGERLSAWLESYGLGLREALECAARQGYRSVQIGTAYLRDVQHRGGQLVEVPCGQGVVDFAAILGGAGDAVLVIRRDAGAGIDALRPGREYIESLCGRIRGR